MQMRIILIYRMLRLSLAYLIIASSLSCTPPSTVNKGQFYILTSFYPMFIHALNITKDITDVRVVNLTPAQTGCLHDYSLTTRDCKALESASVFIINGAGLESFMDKIIIQYPDLPVIDASNEIMKQNKNPNPDDHNPHLWVSMTLAIGQVKCIGDKLSLIDPDHAWQYNQNTLEYIQKLEQLKTEMHNALDSLVKTEIITFHEAFHYFAEEFDLKIASVVEREPGKEPSAAELVSLIRLIRDKDIHSLFVEPQYSQKIAQTLSRETGVRLYFLDPAVTGPADADAYIHIMEKNKQTLVEAFTHP